MSTDPEKRFIKHNESLYSGDSMMRIKKLNIAVFQPGMKFSGDHLQKIFIWLSCESKKCERMLFLPKKTIMCLLICM